MLNVMLTVDTEVYPNTANWRTEGLGRDLARDIDAATPAGAFGIDYQMEVLNRHGLKATFFVESLFACAVGLEPLRDIVGRIQEKGHEAQLHLHTEWLDWMSPSVLPGRSGYNIRDFTEDEQAFLLGKGLENLRAAGARDVRAYRAGNYGASPATLRALRRNGILYDSSYNVAYLGRDCALDTGRPMHQPEEIEGVVEFPIASFEDWPGHARPAQLRACSAAEMQGAIESAWRRKWFSFVIVSHSFELINRPADHARPPAPHRIAIRRFEKLCEFLGRNRDRFRTTLFRELSRADIPTGRPVEPLRSSTLRTVRRFGEQAVSRILYRP